MNAEVTLLSSVQLDAVGVDVHRPSSQLRWQRFLSGARFDYIVFAVIAVGVLAVVARSAWTSTFWYDETYTLGVMHMGSLRDVLAVSLNMSEPIPPLYYVFIWFWGKLTILVLGAPVGPGILLLPSMLAVVAAIFVTGVAARALLGGGLASWITCLLCATSVSWIRQGVNLRYYAFLHLFAAIIILLTIMVTKATKSPGQTIDGASPTQRVWRLRILLGFFMALAALTSYSALYWLAALAICQTVLVIAKRLNPRVLLPYLVAVICYVPYILAMIYMVIVRHASRDLNLFWFPTPNLHSLGPVYTTLLGTPLMLFLYLFALVFIAIATFGGKASVHAVRPALATILTFVGCPAVMIALVYVYSAYLFPDGSIFLPRYFQLFWPMLCITMGFVISAVIDEARPRLKSATTAFVWALVGALGLMHIYPWVDQISQSTKYIVQVFQQQANYLAAQPDINSPGVSVYMPLPPVPTDGWHWYYVTKQGTEPGFPVVWTAPINAKKIYLCLTIGGSPSPDLLAQYTVTDHIEDMNLWVLVRNPS